MDSQPAKKSRSFRVRHWKLGIWVGCFLLAISATIPWYETPEAEHYRKLVKINEGKAVEVAGEKVEAWQRQTLEAYVELLRSESLPSPIDLIYRLLGNRRDSTFLLPSSRILRSPLWRTRTEFLRPQ